MMGWGGGVQGSSLECVCVGGAGPAVLVELEVNRSVETFSFVGLSLGVFGHDCVQILSFLALRRGLLEKGGIDVPQKMGPPSVGYGMTSTPPPTTQKVQVVQYGTGWGGLSRWHGLGSGCGNPLYHSLAPTFTPCCPIVAHRTTTKFPPGVTWIWFPRERF